MKDFKYSMNGVRPSNISNNKQIPSKTPQINFSIASKNTGLFTKILVKNTQLPQEPSRQLERSPMPSTNISKSPMKLLNYLYAKQQENSKKANLNINSNAKQYIQMKLQNDSVNALYQVNLKKNMHNHNRAQSMHKDKDPENTEERRERESNGLKDFRGAEKSPIKLIKNLSDNKSYVYNRKNSVQEDSTNKQNHISGQYEHKDKDPENTEERRERESNGLKDFRGAEKSPIKLIKNLNDNKSYVYNRKNSVQEDSTNKQNHISGQYDHKAHHVSNLYEKNYCEKNSPYIDKTLYQDKSPLYVDKSINEKNEKIHCIYEKNEKNMMNYEKNEKIQHIYEKNEKNMMNYEKPEKNHSYYEKGNNIFQNPEKIEFKIGRNIDKSILERQMLELKKKTEEERIKLIVQKQKDEQEKSESNIMNIEENIDNRNKNYIFEPFVNFSNFKNIQFKPKAKENKENETAKVAISVPINLTKNQFNFLYVVGKGGFGKVWKVEFKKNKILYAMKEMSKSKVITKRSVSSVMNERQLLSVLKHDFLINMNFAFQDRENLYLVMDLLNGGDLRYHIGRQRRFSEEQTKFFVACVVVGLEYLHHNSIIHRDIKPENLVLDNRGYVRITDLGIARILKPENSSDTSGTPGYMAPEVMCRQNHGFGVDYFALGVIAFEFMLGRRPYLGRSRKEIRDAILAKQIQIKKHEIVDGWTLESADFINKMIQRKPNNRLGKEGAAEVKQHPWLRHFPWEKLLRKEIPAPFLPSSKEDNFDAKQQISLEDNTNEDLIQQNALLLRRNSVQNLFSGYDFDKANFCSSELTTTLAFGKTTFNTTSGSFNY